MTLIHDNEVYGACFVMPSWRRCNISGVTAGVVVGEIGALLEVEKAAGEADLGKLEVIMWSKLSSLIIICRGDRRERGGGDGRDGRGDRNDRAERGDRGERKYDGERRGG